MTESEFHSRIKQIKEAYAERCENAKAGRDQELVRLFIESKWTHEQLWRSPEFAVWACGEISKLLTTGNREHIEADIARSLPHEYGDRLAALLCGMDQKTEGGPA
jgi:hypothetical protein